MHSTTSLLVVYTATVGFLLIAAAAKQRCRRRRHYLTRCALPPYLDSAWMHVLRSQDDKAFIHTMGFDVATFRYLLRGFQPLWQRQESRGSPGSVLAVDALGLTLQYLNSSTPLKALCQVFAMPPATLSRHLRRGMHALLRFVSTDHECRLRWPTPLEMREYCARISAYEPGLQGVFGFVDGVYFECEQPRDRNTQNAYHNTWRGYCSLTNVLVFGPDGCILWASVNAPGAWHDSRVAARLYQRLLNSDQTPAEFVLLSDSAFASKGPMQHRIVCPPKVTERDKFLNDIINHPHAASVEAIVRARQAVEWGMHTLQSSFRRLHVVFIFDPPYTQRMLKLILHLYNLRTRRLGLSQIRSVYVGPIGRAEDG